jgi:hypothetical protein
MDAGIIQTDKNRYYLRDQNLANMIAAMQKDLSKQMKELMEIAEDIDKKLKLE